MSPLRVWLVLALVYAAFFFWYTSFAGPLRDEEIARYAEQLRALAGGDAEIDRWIQFMKTDSGDDFVMINVMELRETPDRIDGVSPEDTTRDVMMRYAGPFMRQAMMSAAHPVLLGTAAAEALDLWGIEGARRWTNGGLVRYRSRRDLMEQAVNAGTSDIHRFKIAALSKTIAYPLDPWFQLGDPRLVLVLLLAVIGLALHLRWTTHAGSASTSMESAK